MALRDKLHLRKIRPCICQSAVDVFPDLKVKAFVCPGKGNLHIPAVCYQTTPTTSQIIRIRGPEVHNSRHMYGMK